MQRKYETVFDEYEQNLNINSTDLSTEISLKTSTTIYLWEQEIFGTPQLWKHTIATASSSTL
jgi:hypothetical protein